jgi:glycosyltransferase involved in cell wall biosynthesis
MSTEFVTPRCCILIPVYRHMKPLARVLAQIEPYQVPCFLVDDHNEPSLAETLAQELAGRSWITVIRLSVHSGKGVGCVEGARRAAAQGFTHAIMMDADGQHDSGDIPRMMNLMRATPRGMILGRPIFDASAPFSRRFGRLISNSWVWLETLSFDIKDSLFGFRCIPLAPFLKIAADVPLGRRMDFDPDLDVRLFWAGVPAVTFDSKVRYPADGVSNFNLRRDNLRLVSLHTRLFFGMLWRFPSLVKRHWTHA